MIIFNSSMARQSMLEDQKKLESRLEAVEHERDALHSKHGEITRGLKKKLEKRDTQIQMLQATFLEAQGKLQYSEKNCAQLIDEKVVNGLALRDVRVEIRRLRAIIARGGGQDAFAVTQEQEETCPELLEARIEILATELTEKNTMLTEYKAQIHAANVEFSRLKYALKRRCRDESVQCPPVIDVYCGEMEAEMRWFFTLLSFAIIIMIDSFSRSRLTRSPEDVSNYVNSIYKDHTKRIAKYGKIIKENADAGGAVVMGTKRRRGDEGCGYQCFSDDGVGGESVEEEEEEEEAGGSGAKESSSGSDDE